RRVPRRAASRTRHARHGATFRRTGRGTAVGIHLVRLATHLHGPPWTGHSRPDVPPETGRGRTGAPHHGRSRRVGDDRQTRRCAPGPARIRGGRVTAGRTSTGAGRVVLPQQHLRHH